MLKSFMPNPLVSILIPVYLVENYIERCARSVFEQTYDNIEYVFVDDASPDNSISILERVLCEYPERKKHSIIIRHTKNRGLAATRNCAVQACKGKFIFHVDSDDWVESEAVSLLVKKQQETEADIVSGEAIDHKAGKEIPHKNSGWNLDKERLLVSVLTYRVSSSLWRRLIRKSLYTDHGIVANEAGSGGEDYQVFPRLIYYANKVSGIDKYIYHYNINNNTSLTNNIQANIDIQRQGYVSVSVISNFFSDKEQYLQNLIRGSKVKHIHLRMIQNTSWKNKKGYLYFRNLLQTTDKENWHYVGWNNPIKRYIENQYTLLVFISPVRFVYRKSKRLIYKLLKSK